MAEKCVVCGRAKGTRQCPGLGGLVCSLCCGRGRSRTISCPADCEYLVQGRKQALKKLLELGGAPDFEPELAAVLQNLVQALVRIRRERVKDLTDVEAGQALENAISTLRTRTKGLIYEYRSQDPRVQVPADELSRVAENHEQGRAGFRKAEPEEILSCFKHVKRLLDAAMKRGLGFLDLANQAVGYEYVTEAGIRRLLVDGRGRHQD